MPRRASSFASVRLLRRCRKMSFPTSRLVINPKTVGPTYQIFRGRFPSLRHQRECPGRSAGTLPQLYRNAENCRPRRRQFVGIGDVLEARLVAAQPDLMHLEILGGAPVDARGVDGDCGEVAILYQPLRRLGRVAGEMEIGNITGLVCAEVLLLVGPELAPSRARDDDRSIRNASVLLLV